jgi:hypothetical protein
MFYGMLTVKASGHSYALTVKAEAARSVNDPSANVVVGRMLYLPGTFAFSAALVMDCVVMPSLAYMIESVTRRKSNLNVS